MADWTGAGAATARRYAVMADVELRGVSPSYEALCRGISEDEQVCALLDELPAIKRQPNLLLAAVRFGGGPTESYDAFRAWLLDQWRDVSATMTERRTQTNEARRCAVLLPLLAAIDGPVALLEIGASAGLCLLPDRYAYSYDDGPVLGDSPVLLRCATDGVPPAGVRIPDRLPDVRWRAGLDLDPPDLRDEVDVRWLESLVWPEQRDRQQVLRVAVDLAQTDPPLVVRGDARTELESLAGMAPADVTLVVYHSAALAYLTPDDRAAVVDRIRTIAAERRTVWVSNEAAGVVAGTEQAEVDRRFVLARDGVPLARTDPHGGSMQWLADDPGPS